MKLHILLEELFDNSSSEAELKELYGVSFDARVWTSICFLLNGLQMK